MDNPKQGMGEQSRLLTRAFVLAALTNLMVFMGWQTITTGLPVYVSVLGGSNFQIGLITTVATVGAVFCRPFVGALVDRFGRVGFLIAGFIVLVITTAAYAVFPIVGVILVVRFVQGLGWGFGSTTTSTMIADILPRKRFAEGMGYFAMTNSLAIAIAPAAAIWLLEHDNPHLMIAISVVFTVIALVLGLVLAFTSYEQPPLKTDLSWKETFAPKNLFEGTAIFPSAVYAVLTLGFGAITTFIAILGAARGIENMSLYFLVYAIVNVISRPIIGRLVDKYGFYLPGIFSGLCFAASLTLIAFMSNIGMVIAAGALVGIGLGTGMSVFQTMSVAIAPPYRRGAATSTYLTFFNGSLAVGSFAAGILVDLMGYTGMFMVMAAMAVLACVLFMAGGKKRIDQYHKKQQA